MSVYWLLPDLTASYHYPSPAEAGSSLNVVERFCIVEADLRILLPTRVTKTHVDEVLITHIFARKRSTIEPTRADSTDVIL